MDVMKGFDIAQATELYRKEVKQAALKMTKILLTDDELSKMKIGELHEALNLAESYIDITKSQISLKQIAELTDNVENGDLRLSPGQLSDLRRFYNI